MSRPAGLRRLPGMLTWLVRKRLDAFQRAHQYDVGYLRELAEADLRALFAVARAHGLSDYRKDVPRDVYHATKLTAALAEDCGPCAQLVVTLALADRASPTVLAAVVRGDDEALPAEVQLGVGFARAVLAHAPAADDAREEVRRRWGPRAVVSLAFAIVAARMYPTLKYALGHGKACQRVLVGATVVARP